MRGSHRGVKLIGAAAHYGTSDLDESPIIEQDVVRIVHSFSVDNFAAVAGDTVAAAERQVSRSDLAYPQRTSGKQL